MAADMPLIIRQLGLTDYQTTLEAMQQFTAARNTETPDELWVTEHPPVYTLGLNRKNVRLPENGIPVSYVDRGGKITYHGPGQLIIYFMLDLQRNGLNIRQLVTIMESSIIALLAEYSVTANAEKTAPGVYVDGKKIASLGLRLKKQCTYHGLSLNIQMDLEPFNAIDPCGYTGMQMTQLHALGIPLTFEQASTRLLEIIKENLNYV